MRSAQTTTEHLTLCIYRRGRPILGRLLKESSTENLIADDRYRFQAPGPYATYIESCGPLGYQTHFPIVWIETHQAAGPAGSTLQIRATKAPGPGESVWPNEQSQLFKDFHVFPNINPNKIYEANSKVTPPALLRVTHKGVIKRETLFEPAVEELLHWRVYHEGRLIEEGPAAGMKTFDPKSGVGSYVAWIGVVGPNGFMPVSNLLEYPLFPTDTGENVIPAVNNRKVATPGPVERAFITVGDRGRLLPEDREAATRRGFKDRPSPTPRPPETDQEKINRELAELWGVWAFTLENPQITAIPFAPD